MWTYNARVLKVVDGDTIDVEIDLGFKIFSRQRLRLARIDTPEMNDPDPLKRARAQQARDLVMKEVLGGPVVVDTKKTDVYGRWLAEVTYGAMDFPPPKNLSNVLLAAGLADLYKGG
jgi:micrococcal nuclease